MIYFDLKVKECQFDYSSKLNVLRVCNTCNINLKLNSIQQINWKDKLNYVKMFQIKQSHITITTEIISSKDFSTKVRSY